MSSIRAERVARQVCIDCEAPNPPRPDRRPNQRCPRCAAKARKRATEAYRNRKAASRDRCVRCGNRRRKRGVDSNGRPHVHCYKCGRALREQKRQADAERRKARAAKKRAKR